MKNFSLKFLDIMIGLVLGLGFQWWPDLIEPWQFVVFVFVYLDIIDYWIDYGPSLKKFPPKFELDIFLDVGIMFALFLYIYSTQLTVAYFLSAFILLRALDFFWLLRSKYEYHPVGIEGKYVNTWLRIDAFECFFVGGIAWWSTFTTFNPLIMVIIFIAFRIIMRFIASLTYKKVSFI